MFRGGSALGVFLLPITFVVTVFWLRDASGPFWIWHVADASYFYLLDSLQMANLNPPGHPYHPGTPVQIIGALTLKAAYPLATDAEKIAVVLDDPERHLRMIGNVLVVFIGAALAIVGAIAWRTTRDRVLTFAAQSGPFLAMLTLMNAFHVKPEPFLMVVMLIFTAVALRALARDDGRHEARYRLALPFGIVAGLGVATKLTAAPVFLFPVFLLGGWRGVLAYGAVAMVSFLVFVSPALPNFDLFLDFAIGGLLHAGAYDSGPTTVIDPAVYWRSVAMTGMRPLILGPIVLSLGALLVAWRRRTKGYPIPAFETRALAGVALALTAQVLAVAKQPSTYYLIPAFMLGALFLVLFIRFTAGLGIGSTWVRSQSRQVLIAFAAAVVLAQGIAVLRLHRNLSETAAQAVGADMARFDHCARLDYFPASTPDFALHIADWWTSSRLTAEVADRVAPNAYWFDPDMNNLRLWDWKGQPADIGRVMTENPCVVLRGGPPEPILEFVQRVVPKAQFGTRCSTRDETILVEGADCTGAPLP